MSRWFDNLSMQKKLFTGFGFLGLVILLVSVVGYQGMTRVSRAGDELWAGTRLVDQAGQWEVFLERYQKELSHAILADNERDREAATANMAEYSRIISEYQRFIEDNVPDEDAQYFQSASAARAAFLPVAGEVVELVGRGRLQEAEDLATGEAMRLGDAYAAAVKELNVQFLERAGVLNADSEKTASLASSVILGSTALGLLLGMVLAVVLSRIIARRVRTVAERAEELRARCITNLGAALAELADGDVDVTPEYGTPKLEWEADDEIGQLADTVDGIIDQCVAAIEAFIRTTESLRGLTGETRRLTAAAQEGRLDERGDADAFSGAYHDLVAGINGTLDRVLGPIDEAAAVLDRLAARDLSARVEGDYSGDHARIKTALNKAAANLDETLSEVGAAASQVAAAASQISSGSQGLAQGANEQASSLEEISSSLQELSSMADNNAANAREASSISGEAGTLAGGGVERMGELSRAIQLIKKSSDETAKIVGTIDEIAFQTNLLALNAAVEAARAGDAGKGFAVVAEEVRALAQRSAEAAKSTAAMIEEASGHAENGVQLNEAVVAQLGEIDTGVRRVGEVIQEIAAASEQQTQGVGEINGGIEQLNSVTQQTAANAEESASTSEELSSQAALLERMVAAFTLSHSATGVEAGSQTVPGAGRSNGSARRPVTNGNGNGSGPRAQVVEALTDAEKGLLAEF